MALRRVTRPDLHHREVIVCVAGLAEQLRLGNALRTSAVIRSCTTVVELERLLAVAGPTLRMVIVEPRDTAGQPAARVLRELTRRRPDVVVIGYCRADSEDSRLIIELAQAGVHELLF